MVLSPLLKPVSYAQLPGWTADSHARAFTAFRRCAARERTKPYRTGSLGIDGEAFGPAYAAAASSGSLADSDARAFFESFFIPCHVLPDAGTEGLVTGFYEPVVDASSARDGKHAVPLLSRPSDLIDIDDSNRPPGFDPCFAFGRLTATGIEEYPDRRRIESEGLGSAATALAWLASKVDAFFIHVQGAARLRLEDGTQRRITYAAKSGHRFTGVGGLLVAMGEIAQAEISMQSIRRWLHAHPDRVDEILWRNRSYIFFRQTPLGDPDAGPVAAAKVQLEPGRSVAVDRLIHTFGTPIHIDAPALERFGRAPFRRLMIAQDTGSAITGSARGDLFAGSGDAAGEIAGAINHKAGFYALVPRQLVEAGR